MTKFNTIDIKFIMITLLLENLYYNIYNDKNTNYSDKNLANIFEKIITFYNKNCIKISNYNKNMNKYENIENNNEKIENIKNEQDLIICIKYYYYIIANIQYNYPIIKFSSRNINKKDKDKLYLFNNLNNSLNCLYNIFLSNKKDIIRSKSKSEDKKSKK